MKSNMAPGDTDHTRAINLLWKSLTVFLVVIALALVAATIVVVKRLIPEPAGTFKNLDLHERLYYDLVWITITMTGIVLTRKRSYKKVLFAIVLLLVLELSAQGIFIAVTGNFYNPGSPLRELRFQPHPLLQGIPRPGTYERYGHDDKHQRITINENKEKNANVIFLYGGSSTYDLGVGDRETWASQLSRTLGSDFIVENQGVPGYTTVEALIQTNFDFRFRHPKCAIYYEGFNDLRNSHIKNLQPDFSDFHLPSQTDNLRTRGATSLLARRSAIVKILQSPLKGKQTNVEGEVSDQYDKRLSDIYKGNLRLIALIAKDSGVKPIFIPQVLNSRVLTKNQTTNWFPFTRETDIRELLDFMNKDMEEVAKSANVLFLHEPLEIDWKKDDFTDEVHFSTKGAKKFADSISKHIARECR